MAQASDPSLPPRVIIVEDDTALSGALQFSLELEGFSVEVCGSGEDLLALDLPLRRACLVIDQGLPGVAGIEALIRLRRRGVGLPAIIITTHPEDHLKRAAHRAHASVVEKPLLGDGLISEIKGLLADRRGG